MLKIAVKAAQAVKAAEMCGIGNGDFILCAQKIHRAVYPESIQILGKAHTHKTFKGARKIGVAIGQFLGRGMESAIIVIVFLNIPKRLIYKDSLLVGGSVLKLACFGKFAENGIQQPLLLKWISSVK